MRHFCIHRILLSSRLVAPTWTPSLSTYTTRRHLHCTPPALLPDRSMSASVFDTSLLPPQLREEFDSDANVIGLQHIIDRAAASQRRQASSSSASVDGGDTDTTTSVRVLPTWVHLVNWKCQTCSAKWSARPVDRMNNQVSAAYGCQQCHSRSSSSSGNTLISQYPNLAAQWDTQRNSHLHNNVLQSLEDIKTTSQTRVWWKCSLCKTPWAESVRNRVHRHEGALQSVTSESARKAHISLCPACEQRGATRRVNAPAPAAVQKQSRAMLLRDDPILMEEARLKPDQDPSQISLLSETVVTWNCRTCSYVFQASVANRHLRHDRCPQCSGKVKTPLNLLVIQRPDVVDEVSKHISRTKLSFVTIYDDTEIQFVCRKCLSPYRMTAKTRCAIPKGGIACSKCFHTYSQTAAKHAANKKLNNNNNNGTTASLSRKERRLLVRTAGRLCTSGRCNERLEVTRNELDRRDGSLRN